MSDVVLALIASLPGLLLGVAALLKARQTPAAVLTVQKEMQSRLDRQRADLDDANEKIERLTERMDECAAERMTLMRENLDLWRRLHP